MKTEPSNQSSVVVGKLGFSEPWVRPVFDAEELGQAPAAAPFLRELLARPGHGDLGAAVALSTPAASTPKGSTVQSGQGLTLGMVSKPALLRHPPPDCGTGVPLQTLRGTSPMRESGGENSLASHPTPDLSLVQRMLPGEAVKAGDSSTAGPGQSRLLTHAGGRQSHWILRDPEVASALAPTHSST